jgi:hypothetical protein
MAEEKHQRPFPSTDAYGRPAQAPGHASGGGDPLAELARLIGQNDPFSEYGRNDARRQSAPAQAAPQEWAPQPAHTAYPSPTTQPDPRMTAPGANFGNSDFYNGQPAAHEQPQFGAASLDRPLFGGRQFNGNAEAYRDEVPGYPSAQQDAGYEQDPYYQQKSNLTPEGEDLYEDETPPRRRFSVMAIAAVFALAVVGTAGAFGYRALFGSSGTTQPPPVIKADTAPSKIVAAASGKAISDRVGTPAAPEKLVSRQEAPVEMAEKPTRVIFPGGAATNMVQSAPPANGSGVLVGEPKKIRTITIRPDQPVVAESAPKATPAAPARAAPATPVTRIASAPAADEPPAPAPVRQAPVRAAPAPSNAPLSLNPTETTTASAARAIPAPARSAPQLASAGPPNGSNGGNGAYAVQVSSQRSEAEAQASFRALQSRFSNVLGNQPSIIRRVDLGSKGVYYRAMVGPFDSSNQASDLCSSLKAAGGDCVIQRN